MTSLTKIAQIQNLDSVYNLPHKKRKNSITNTFSCQTSNLFSHTANFFCPYLKNTITSPNTSKGRW